MTHQNEASSNEIVGRTAVEAGLRHFVPVVAILALVCYAWIYTTNIADVPIRSDGYSYYVYLPSTFLYGDFTLDALARDWFGGIYPEFTGIRRWPATGRWVNPHPIGPAILSAPFFVAAHVLTRWSNLPPDGFSLYYQHGAGLAGLAYLAAGVMVLRRLLCRHFPPGSCSPHWLRRRGARICFTTVSTTASSAMCSRSFSSRAWCRSLSSGGTRPRLAALRSSVSSEDSLF